MSRRADTRSGAPIVFSTTALYCISSKENLPSPADNARPNHLNEPHRSASKRALASPPKGSLVERNPSRCLTKSTLSDLDWSGMRCFVHRLPYELLFKIFEHLNCLEIVRAGAVCKLWREVAHHALIWSQLLVEPRYLSPQHGYISNLSSPQQKERLP